MTSEYSCYLLASSFHRLDEISEWCKDNNIECKMSTHAYMNKVDIFYDTYTFKQEEHLVFFKLRWGHLFE